MKIKSKTTLLIVLVLFVLNGYSTDTISLTCSIPIKNGYILNQPLRFLISYIPNDGVIIYTNANIPCVEVTSMSNGTVFKILELEGDSIIVIKSDPYLLWYVNVKLLKLKVKDEVKQGSVIGYLDPQSIRYGLHLMIAKKDSMLNFEEHLKFIEKICKQYNIMQIKGSGPSWRKHPLVPVKLCKVNVNSTSLRGTKQSASAL